MAPIEKQYENALQERVWVGKVKEYSDDYYQLNLILFPTRPRLATSGAFFFIH
jgi:hypothetical protein